MIDRRSAAFFLVTSVLFGGTFVGAKAGLEYFPPLLFVALRFDVAAVALASYVVLTRSRAELVPRTRGDVAGILATGLVAIGLTNALLFVGQQSVTSGVASIITSLNPILTPVFAAALVADERLSRRGALGMVIGLVGVGLVVSPDPANLLAGGVAGKVILFGAATCGALGAVLIRRADAGLSSTVRVAWGLPLGALLCHGLSLGSGESPAAITWAPEAVAALAFVGLFAGALAYITYFGLLDEVGAIHANLVFYVVPVVATLGGWALLDEVGAIHANLVFYVVPVVATLGGWALLDETVAPLALVGFVVIFAGFAVIGSASVDRPTLRRAPIADGGVADGAVTDESAGRSDDARGCRAD